MRALLGLALVLVLAACGGTTAPPTASSRTVWTGDVSEDELLRLHERTTEVPPSPRGQEIALGGGHAYLALPEGSPRAALLVIHEWWGLNDHIRHWADRLAADGYAALAIDLYGGRTAATSEEAMELMRAVDDTQADATIRDAITFLESDPRVASAQRHGVIGWCFGGGWALEAALRHPGASDAVVMYYGRPVTDVERLRALDSPLLGIFGDLDESIPPERVDEFEAALEAAEVPHELLRFDAPHAFANPSGPRYDHDAAAAAWEATRAFLARTL
ncbi:MAG: dienelactone hydrolase family protein [Myxococcota bacterium]|nr:dienelactone hydrolase family protein [Myxococcota bacterium]